MKKSFILIILTVLSLQAMNAQCVDNGNVWNESWTSCTTSESPNTARGNSFWIMYEFHEDQYIDSTHVWNANRAGESNLGADNVAIDYSVDGTTWIELGQYNFPQAPETDDYTGFSGPDFEGVQLKKVLVTILSTHGGNGCASLAEMKFMIDSTACYGIVDVCGICDGLGETTWYLDADEDGLGDTNVPFTGCEQPDGYVLQGGDPCDDGGIGWSEMEALFSDNGCSGPYCHGGGASGLDLNSYASISQGGVICGPVLLSGTTLVDIIMIPDYNGCNSMVSAPAMNDRAGGLLDATEIALIQAWVNGGAPEDCADFCPDFAPEEPYNGIDDDCDPLTLDDDLDGDGFGIAVDCNDEDPNINPDAVDIPDNNIDEDCNGTDLTTSILELSNVTINIYPNPTDDIVYIDVSGPLDYKAVVFDMLGKEVMSSTNESILKLKSLPDGSYLIYIIDQETNGQVVKKIVKTK